MDEMVRELSESLVRRLSEIDESQRLLVGLAGIPASGKTTLARLVVAGCNRMLNRVAHQQASTSIGVESKESSSKDEDEAETRYLHPPPTAASTGLGMGFSSNGRNTIAHIPSALAISQDGWRYPRAFLDAFPDPTLAHHRRGTHWTYDASAYEAFVRALREPLCLPVSIPLWSTTGLELGLTFPPPSSAASVREARRQSFTLPTSASSFSFQTPAYQTQTQTHLPLPFPGPILTYPIFSHTTNDSGEATLGNLFFTSARVLPTHRIVIFEGPYTLLSLPGSPFSAAAQLLDERWLLECPECVARGRVSRRQPLDIDVESGGEGNHGKGEEEARKRMKGNCILNGQFILQNLVPPTRKIEAVTIEDPTLA